MAETWLMRGEGGSIIPMDLPLPHEIQQRVDAGLILRVNPDGSPWSGGEPAKRKPGPVEDVVDVAEPAEDLVPEVDGLDDAPVNVRRPKQVQPKDVWVAWIVYSTDLSDEQAQAMTKAELIKYDQQQNG